MGLLHRRLPLYGRPLAALPFALGVALGLYLGLNWTWRWSLQTGNIFLLILVPSDLVTMRGGKALWLAAAALCLTGLFTLGLTNRDRAERLVRAGTAWWWRPRFRFYPLTFLFGLFILYFGLVFLFDAAVSADDAPGGLATFVYLDYAGLTDRPFITAVGILLSGLGLGCVTMLAFQAGAGLERRAPWAPTQNATLPTPAPASPGVSPRPTLAASAPLVRARPVTAGRHVAKRAPSTTRSVSTVARIRARPEADTDGPPAYGS